MAAVTLSRVACSSVCSDLTGRPVAASRRERAMVCSRPSSGMPASLHVIGRRRKSSFLVAAAGPDMAAELAAMQKFKEELRAKLDHSQKEWRRDLELSAQASTAPSGETPAVEGRQLEDLTSENFWDKVKGAGSKVVVVDCYTTWCGPCKVILPQLEQLAAEMKDHVVFYKFNCNKENKTVAQGLGVKVAPTFFIFKNGEQKAMLTGAKLDPLKEAIAAAL
eukprot:jgi/Mesvir1/11465/Mv04611-RA.1